MEIFYFENNITLILYMFQLLLAEVLFCLSMKRRKDFIVRLICGGALFLVISYFVPILIYQITPGFLTMSVFIISLFYIWFCFNGSFFDALYCGLGAVTTQNLADNICYRLIYSSFAGPKDSSFIATPVLVISYAAVYITCFIIFAKRVEGIGELSINKLPMILLITTVTFFTFTAQFFLMNSGYDNFWTRLPFICICIMSLCLQYGLFERTRLNEEKNILEQILLKEQRQLKMKEDNIEIINLKCHDLKNQIASLKYVVDDKSNEELKKIEQSIMIYDSIPKTGNKTLDVVLSEKTFICEKYDIRFTYIADGAILDNLSSMDIVSIFGNALDNAIEYLQTVDKEKRILSMQVYERNDLIIIHIENYCSERLKIVSGLPITSKKDKNYHGYGLKSIKMVVERYEGNFVVTALNNRFSMDIIIPTISLT